MTSHLKRGVQSVESKNAFDTALYLAKQNARFKFRPAFARKIRVKAPVVRNLIAYDWETTRIDVGTPRLLYLTAHGADFSIDTRIESFAHATKILKTHFLTDELKGTGFVAWNGNRYDAYFVAACLIREPEFVLRPYLTKSKALRGLQVRLREDMDKRNAKGWEFLDGIAMTGLAGVSLDKFVENFAPAFPKLKTIINFDKEDFDPDNPEHRKYAYRDSEGLYHAITRAQNIMLETFDQPLAVTMGGVCIRIFQAHIPEEIQIEPLTVDLNEIVTRYVMRGGYCYCNKRYDGPVWKYDINQAYAAAMREAKLPSGAALNLQSPPPPNCRNYIARLTATNYKNKIPFYYRHTDASGRTRSMFSFHEIEETWLTSIEVEQLRNENWDIQIEECWAWGGDGFSMEEYVNKLEHLRKHCDGGPSGPIGTMVKATGNHSFGKLAEVLEPIEYLLSAECPENALPYYGDGSDPIEHIYYRIDEERKAKDYHQPHLSSWITAYVRMVVRRAALVSPSTWLYADTDCVVFSSDVTDKLDIDAKRYGAWKIEESGTRYKIIAKKVYTQVGGEKPKRSAKGLHVKKLTADDFEQWYNGNPPMQDQVQIQNFLSVMHGAQMFSAQHRKGTAIEISTA